MSDPNVEPNITASEPGSPGNVIGGVLSPDGTAAATGFATGVPDAADVDPADADLEGGAGDREVSEGGGAP